LIIVLAGGFTTNLLWCGFLNIRNKTGGNYLRSSVEAPPFDATVPRIERVPLLVNYALCAVAGTLWYLQFFFYGMGTTKMGRYDFSSWTLHMATIIIFGTLVGLCLSEWKGVSRGTYRLMQLGLVVLVSSTVVIGYGNYLAKERTPAADPPKVSETRADSPKVVEAPVK
jgi:L-rhamnose-H+ transport protein